MFWRVRVSLWQNITVNLLKKVLVPIDILFYVYRIIKNFTIILNKITSNLILLVYNFF